METTKQFILNDPFLNKTDRKILFHFLSIFNLQYNKGLTQINVKQSTLAIRFNVNPSYISKCLKNLETHHYISSQKIKTRKIYFLDWNSISEKKNNQLEMFQESFRNVSESCNQLEKQEVKPRFETPIINNSNNYIKQQQHETPEKVNSVNLQNQAVVVFPEIKSNIIQKTIIHRLINQKISPEIIQKSIQYLETELTKPQRVINNINGYFVNLCRQAHKGQWQFTATDSQSHKEKARQQRIENQCQKMKEQCQQAEKVFDTREQAMVIFENMSPIEKKELESSVRQDHREMDRELLNRMITMLMINKIENECQQVPEGCHEVEKVCQSGVEEMANVGDVLIQ